MAKSLPNNGQRQSSTSPPAMISIIRKCQHYGVSYDLMSRMNYQDLMALLIEYEIEDMQRVLKDLAQQHDAEQGRVTVLATPEQATEFFGKT